MSLISNWGYNFLLIILYLETKIVKIQIKLFARTLFLMKRPCLSIPISAQSNDDKLVWFKDDNANFSVKSCYKLRSIGRSLYNYHQTRQCIKLNVE